MPKLILVRHGQTSYNVEFRYQGHTDIPLNEVGLAQAATLQTRLSGYKLDAVFSSDLQRAQRTAEIALENHPSGLKPQATALLREVNGGGFEGLSWSEISEKYPELSARWRENRATISPPDGENLTEVAARLSRFLDQIMEEYPAEDQTILVVAHGGTIGILISYLLGMDLNKIWQLRTDNCSVTILDVYAKGAILSLFNDAHHVEKLNFE